MLWILLFVLTLLLPAVATIVYSTLASPAALLTYIFFDAPSCQALTHWFWFTLLFPSLERETSTLLWLTQALAFFYRLRPTKPLPTRDKLQSSQVTLRLFNHYFILPSKRFRPQSKSTNQRERLDHQLQREHFTRAQPPNSSFTGNTFTPFKQSTIKSFQILLQLF
jgi:hypothetical protein